MGGNIRELNCRRFRGDTGVWNKKKKDSLHVKLEEEEVGTETKECSF